ncbi:MAG: N-formylglutamate amidohydrolase [Bacteroidetes bacterium]|nr:N-formylglutamate amidohydrolase [Bacteroidota bacterium]
MNYRLEVPAGERVPILLSVPHCGSFVPDELRSAFEPQALQQLDDTDWFVDRLYGFAASMGITMLSATISRWVIDLNRDPLDKPLYSDGRVITGLCPVTDFLGTSIYKDNRKSVEIQEIARRKELYYKPYHDALQSQLDQLVNEFGKVLLWECHSIRKVVPSIYSKPFPDLIVGDAGGTSASPGLIESALSNLDHGDYSVSHNHPFMGGYITRHYGNPSVNRHAIQLEMAKVNYMDDSERNWDEPRALKMQSLLKKTLEGQIAMLTGS